MGGGDRGPLDKRGGIKKMAGVGPEGGGGGGIDTHTLLDVRQTQSRGSVGCQNCASRVSFLSFSFCFVLATVVYVFHCATERRGGEAGSGGASTPLADI